MPINRPRTFLLIILGLLISSADLALVSAPLAVTDVPVEYQKLYANLKSYLDTFDAYLNTRTVTGTYPTIFAAELIPANDNRGTELLNPNVMRSVRIYLDRLQELGVQGVTFPIGYPLYTPNFPHYQEYVQFYKQVVQEVRKHGLTIDIETAVIFANTPFSSFNINYANLTFDQFKVERKQMIAAIIRDLKPDYLNLGSEPDTEAQLLGMKELNDPAKYTEYITYLITGLDKGNTKMGSGIGSWGNLAYVNSLVNTSIDSIHIHVYPITGRFLQNILTISDMAKQHEKRVILDEAWLYKTDAPSTNGVAASLEIFRRDLFSFWTPLDEQFLTTIATAAQLAKIDYVSPFWTQLFFGYSDYDQNTGQMPYKQLVAMTNQIASQNIQSNRFSSTGLAYKALISYNNPSTASISMITTESSISTMENRTGTGILFAVVSAIAIGIVGLILLLSHHYRKTSKNS